MERKSRPTGYKSDGLLCAWFRLRREGVGDFTHNRNLLYLISLGQTSDWTLASTDQMIPRFESLPMAKYLRLAVAFVTRATYVISGCTVEKTNDSLGYCPFTPLVGETKSYQTLCVERVHNLLKLKDFYND